MNDPTRTATPVHRRIAEATANIRAADQKAALVLAGLGLASAGLGSLPAAAAVLVGVGLIASAALLGLVLLPRTQGTWTALADADPALVLDLVDLAERPDALAAELTDLTRIAVRKYALVRIGLLATAATVAVYAAAALASTIH
ncbi:hypothetical protein [Streptomyces sp. SID3343]|uniref:hypothetical protein n=1 Tax=Streptomyces sp. SID3343 TaxID=2690260 RepID=UPI001367AF4E|nr:hypothetical protein [Streptomyces sp. SID3343]MYW06044.1 hypothetical protein [Streptomyces sp. SID3343]